MKRINLKSLILLIYLIMSKTEASVPANGTVGLKYPSYSLVVPDSITFDSKSSSVPIIIGRVVSDSKINTFGIEFRGDRKKLSSQPIIELFNADTKKLIKSISVAEYFGVENKNWKLIANESVQNESLNIKTYEFSIKENKFKFQKRVSVYADSSLPLGKGLEVVYIITSDKDIKIEAKLKFASRGSANLNNNTFYIKDAYEHSSIKNALICNLNKGASVKLKESSNKKINEITEISRSAVSLPANKSIALLTFRLAGTTVNIPEQIELQVQNLIEYFNDGKKAPELVAVTTIDKQNTNPGDTVKYSIIYNNIGTAPAVDIGINNPIPDGTIYLEGTAEGLDSKISISKTQNSKTVIDWKFERSISPGENRVVSYKVIVK